MSEEPKPCPFCGGTDIAISVDENQGNKWGSAVCFSCSAVGPEVRTGYETYPEASWRAEAAAEWNRRASPTPPTTECEGDARKAAKRIVDWDDGGRLADDEWLVERNETAIIAICRALLSSPRVEEVRREALEEAAKVADEVAADERAEKIADKEAEGKDYDPYSYGAGFLDGSWVTAQNIAKAIRSLSLPDGEGDKQATRASGPTAPTDR